MEKMMEIINGNLRSVVNSIKDHCHEKEKMLTMVKVDMAERIGIATTYKAEIEKSREIIVTREKEISELEHDLQELNDKFGSKDFKEIISAGNREINTKIIEKQADITKERDKILDLNNKAHHLKDDLLNLKARKKELESALSAATKLLNYYEKRIEEVISYAEQHPNALDQYISLPSPESYELKDVNVDTKELENIVDGSIFEEIDEISSNAPIAVNIDETILDEDNENADSETEYALVPQPVDLSMTQQLDNLIAQANELLEKEEQQKTAEEEPIEYIDIHVPEDAETKTLENTNEPDYINNTISNSLFQDDLELAPKVQDVSSTPEDIIPEENDFALNEEEPVSAEEEKGFYADLRELNLDPDEFSEESLIRLENNFNKKNVEKFIDVMVRHQISLSKIYENVNVLLSVTPENLDMMLTLLEKSGATNVAISYVFNKLDIVNINKLEEAVDSMTGSSLAEILYEALPYRGEDDLRNMLDLDKHEYNDLKASAKKELFEMMNIFADIVLANYNTLKATNINNLRECLIYHPRRFVMNPDSFTAMLDKYDPDDLVRCINKNAAVLDKL